MQAVSPASGNEPSKRPLRRIAIIATLVILAAWALWWGWDRFTVVDRRMAVRGGDAVARVGTVPGDRVRVLAWNIAHGRGDPEPGWFQSWQGGTPEERRTRLLRMGDLLRSTAADVVVLNEVDFDAGWSGGENQAELLAGAADYPGWVEQRSFDFLLPFERYAFGNAVLTSLPIREARWVDLPAYSRLERIVWGAKAAPITRLETGGGPISVVAVHLEFRDEATRLAAVRTIEELRRSEPAPMILAGDFNSAPPGWPGADEETVLGTLLDRGWRSPRAEGVFSESQRTFPRGLPGGALDWILVEPPLRIHEARIVASAEGLSDHLPILAVIELPDRGGVP